MIMLTFAMIMQVPVKADTTLNVKDYLIINAAPSPVGVGQTVFLSLFFDKPVPVIGAFGGGTLLENLKINIIKPDGTNETLGPYTTDQTGGVGGITYSPATTGNYTFQGIFPGQNIGTDPFTNTTYYIYPDMSPAVTVVVQEEPIPYYSGSPLPTNYWTRPIYASNYNWAQTIGGNWYGCGRPAFNNCGGYDASNNNYNPYSTAPKTAHILWTKPTTTGGQPGGETVADQNSAYCASSPLYHYLEPVILNGICYYNYWAAQTDNAGILAVDIRTGQILWQKTTSDVLIYGQVMTFHNNEEFGSQAFLWTSRFIGYDGMGMFGPNPIYDYVIVDPVTGNDMATVTDIPSAIAGLFATSIAASIDNEPYSGFYCSGGLLIHWADSGQLYMWNSTLMLAGPPGPFPGTPYKPSGSYNFTAGIQWNVTIPAANPAYSMGMTPIADDTIILTSYGSILPTFAVQYGAATATDIAYNSKTGALLWGPVTQTLTEQHQVGIVAVGEGAYVRHDRDTNELIGYSLKTGQKLWGPTKLVGSPLSYLYESAAIAYGKVYLWDYGGYCNAVDLTTGKLDWTYTRGTSGYDNPFGVYPLWVYDSQTIADGMLFLSEGKLYDPPLFPNGEKIALNCTDGSVVWEINGAFQRDTAPVADGEMLAWNGYDGQIYAFGTGATKTTVTAPNVGVTTSAPITITGTVTDLSSGASQDAVASNFPNGLPCVSDESMTPFMEAVYEQQPMPSNVTGVPVTIDVIDANNNYRTIGTARSDASGFYSFSWTPDIPGKYTVIATFAGSQSYYSSYAETAFTAAEPVSTASPEPTKAPATAADLYLLPGIGAIIAAIAIVGAILALMLRRK
jgi:outer membrane protein assembly factor BamB